MKVALATAGSRGDTQPCLALALGLMEAGHEALVIGAPDFADWAGEMGIEYRVLGQNIQNWLGRIADVIHSPIRMGARLSDELVVEMDTQFKGIDELIGEPDVVLGASLMIAARSFAERHDLPYRHIAYCPQTLPSGAHPPPVVPWQRHARVLNRVYWKGLHMGFNVLLRKPLNKYRKERGLPAVRDAYEHIVERGLLMASEPCLADVPSDHPWDIAHTGAWTLREDKQSLPDGLEQFLEAGEPPIYVGFGSMPDADPHTTTQLLVKTALLLNTRMLISTGWAKLGAQGLPESARMVGSVPHDLLLPRTSAIVHHGGAGTTTAAARAGVPQLLIPHLLDQFYWGHQIETRGLGPSPLPRNRLDPGRLASALQPCLTSRELIARCKQTGETIRANNGIGNAVTFLEGLVQ